jgi:hypothetical protein
MKVYFNHQRELVETIVSYGFTDDILRSLEYSEVPGVELRADEPDPNEGCLMPPEGATAEMDIPEDELLEHEVLADGWEDDGFRHAGLGRREFIVPARVVNRYDRRLYVEEAPGT